MKQYQQKYKGRIQKPTKQNQNSRELPETIDAEPGTVKHRDNGLITAKEAGTEIPLKAKEIDEEYFQDTGEVVVLEWEREL